MCCNRKVIWRPFYRWLLLNGNIATSDLGCKFLGTLLQYMGGYCFLSCLKMQYHVRIATKFCGCTSCHSRCNCIRLMAMRSTLVALKFFWGPKLLPQAITRPAMISSEPKFRRPSWDLAPVRLPPWLERPRPTSCQQLAHLPTPSCPYCQSRVPSCADSSSF